MAWEVGRVRSLCGEVYLASFLSPNLATQSVADSRSGVPVAKLAKALSWVRGARDL